MNPNDFVYQSIYKGCKSAGVTESIAHSQSVIGLDKYKKGAIGGMKVGDFIKSMIIQAKKMSKGVRP